MKKIIVVEDDTDLLETLSLFLEDEGHKVWKFSKSKPAYRKIVKCVPDVVIVDVRLPGVNGDILASLVKQDERFKSTKVILISAGEGLEKLAQEAQVNAFLRKPFSMEKLIKLI